MDGQRDGREEGREEGREQRAGSVLPSDGGAAPATSPRRTHGPPHLAGGEVQEHLGPRHAHVEEASMQCAHRRAGEARRVGCIGRDGQARPYSSSRTSPDSSARRCGRMPSSTAATKTTGHSRPGRHHRGAPAPPSRLICGREVERGRQRRTFGGMQGADRDRLRLSPVRGDVRRNGRRVQKSAHPSAKSWPGPSPLTSIRHVLKVIACLGRATYSAGSSTTASSAATLDTGPLVLLDDVAEATPRSSSRMSRSLSDGHAVPVARPAVSATDAASFLSKMPA